MWVLPKDVNGGAYRRHGLIPLIGALCFLSGCGSGGGGGGTTPSPSPTPTPSPSPTPVLMARPQITVNWGARSRVVTLPASALSLTIDLHGDSGSVVFTANRPSGLAASSQTYAAPTEIPVGTYQVNVTGFAQSNGTGAKVASADIQVNLGPYGLLPPISLVQAITSVEIPAGQNIPVNQQPDLIVTPRDAAGNVVVVTPGSCFMSVTSNGQRLRYISGTQVEGLLPGPATMTASIDGITSPAATVTVVSNTQVSVSPSTAEIAPGTTLPLTATVTNAPNTTVTWSIQEGNSGGTVSSTGLYTAPSTPGTYHVIATSVYDPAHSGTATISVETGSIGVVVN